MLRIFYLLSVTLLICSCTHLSESERVPASVHDTRNCLETIDTFMKVNPTKSGPIITGSSSLGMKIPDFEKFRSEMLSKRPSVENFVKNYSSDTKRPTNLEVLDFYTKSSEELAKHIRSGKGIDEGLDHYLELSAAQIELSPSKLEKVVEYKTLPENKELMSALYNPRESDSRQILDSLGWTNYKGHLGELDVLLRLQNLQAQGVYLSRRELLDPKAQAINDIFATKLEEKISAVTLENLSTYMEKFPRIFKSDDELTDEEILRRAKIFLDTKEFDLVVKKNNKYSLIEVKNYKNPVGMREASENAGSKKSILDQQLETIEIIHFLGLENEFFLSVAFLRGVTPEAKDVFESKGISVLAEVISTK